MLGLFESPGFGIVSQKWDAYDFVDLAARLSPYSTGLSSCSPSLIQRVAAVAAAVGFTVLLNDGFNTARRCNCSFCRLRGAVSAELRGIEVQQGQDALMLYRFNTGQAKHFFCRHCGIYTFHLRRLPQLRASF